MKEFIILIICLILIVVAFISLTMRKPIQKKTMPPKLEEAFAQYCELVLAKLTLKIKEVELSRFKLLSEIAFEDGQFEYYSFDYRITPDKAVANSNGIILNTTELLAKGGLKGRPLLLFFRQGDAMFEISFLDDRELVQKGYRGYVNFVYANLKNWPISDDYSLKVDGTAITLWQNLKGEPPFPFAVQTRERTHDLLRHTAQFTDTWEGQDLKITSWIQFERKKELIYWIKSTNLVAETNKGIHVGSTLTQLKAAYPRQLSYEEDFKGSGPCYGYIPADGTNRYIAFFVENQRVREIWITDGFDERPFEEPTGYVDNDVAWKEYDNSDKFSERYAREIYVGQHKSDLDVEKVFNSFIGKEYNQMNMIEHGILEESPGQKIYYAICQTKDSSERMNIEVSLRRVKLPTSVTNDEIWIADRYRNQMITD